MKPANAHARQSADLESACARALVRSARAQGVGSRQQIRAAARKFVRRHRRDVGYLRWVLRSLVANAALALGLLGLGAETTSAQVTVLEQQSNAANPFGSAGAPPDDGESVLGDLDGDGDLDLLIGDSFGRIFYLENTGNALSPEFIPRAGAANPLDGQDVGHYATPTLGDLDGDGDLDLFVGSYGGLIFYFENTGTASSPAFAARPGAANPLDGIDLGGLSVPDLGDLDRDGDLDVVVGERWSGLHYFENTGTARVPSFVERIGPDNPLDGLFNTTFFPHSRLRDLDGDGDLDSPDFKNVGDARNPSFVRRGRQLRNHEWLPWFLEGLGDLDADGDFDAVRSGYPRTTTLWLSHKNLSGSLVPQVGEASYLLQLNGPPTLDTGSDSAPTVGDLDGDGDRDLVTGESNGTLLYYAWEPHGTYAFTLKTATANPLDGQDVGDSSTPSLGDLDGDGDLDLVVGESEGTFHSFENTGTPLAPVFVEQTGPANPLDGHDVGSDSAPSLGDFDGDGDSDLVAGAASGLLSYFENTGTTFAPVFVERSGAGNPLDGQSVDSHAGPTVGDADGDGDPDLVVGRNDGSFAYFENTGTRSQPVFVARTGSRNPLDGQDVGDRSKPALFDLNEDGDLDLLAGEADGVFNDFESATVKASLTSFELTDAINPLNALDVGSASPPALVDLDGDGDLDLVGGRETGDFVYFRNTGTALDPSFVELLGASNPLDGLDVGDHAAPTFVDLDGDADLDLVAGNESGIFSYFRNTGTIVDPIFVPASNPLDGVDVGDFARAAFDDLDGDGDLDLVAGDASGDFSFLLNTGTILAPTFASAPNPLAGENVGGLSAPSLRDMDRDGDVDLVAGNSDGLLAYYENTGTAMSAVFVERTGGDNPLDGRDAGSASTPTLADLDADGDFDVVAGNSSGTFSTHHLPEPFQGSMLGAGLALLHGLGRLRRRS